MGKNADGAGQAPDEEGADHLATVTEIMSADADRDDEAESFDEFYTGTWHNAVRWAYGLLGDPAVAEDVTQEAFVVAHTSYTSLENPHGYLRRTIVNLAREHHRASVRRLRRERRSAPREATGASSPGQGILDSLATLTYEQRAVLVLRYWLDWDESTIATALGCANSTVRSHSKRALDRLRDQLKDAS